MVFKPKKGNEMKRNVLTILTVAILICLMMTASAFADTTTAVINPNDTVKGSFTDTVKTYEYTLDLTESGKLELDIHNGCDDSIHYSIKGDGLNRDDYIHPGDAPYDYELAPGQYTITFDNKYGPLGDFSCATKFTPSGETYTEANDSINLIRNSKLIPFKKTVKGQLALNDEGDWFKIELPSSGKLTIDFHSEIDTFEWTIKDIEDKHIKSEYIRKGDYSIVIELTKGTYYMGFNGSDTGNYTFKPAFKASGETYENENETVNLARENNPIPFATVIKGQMALNDTEDCFKLKVPKAGKYSIKVTSKMDSTTLNVRNKNDEYVAQYFHKKGTKIYTVSLKKGNNYLLFERGGNDYGNYSFKVTPATVSIKSLTKASKSFKAVWKKGTGDGYQLQYSTDKNFKKNVKSKTVSSIKTTSKTIKSLKSKKTYYVRIRTYVNGSDGKVWSDWSKAKSVKTL